MSELSLAEASARRFAPLADAYRAIWRWHFYAGLIAVPFMIVLAVTGSLYLFRDEIADTLFAYRNVVAAESSAPLPASQLLARAVASVPGSTPKTLREPKGPTASARVTLKTEAGDTYAFLDPYTGAVLSTVPKADEFNEVVRNIHSLEFVGTYANRIMEAIAGFAVILVVSGLYLWWPRRQTGGVVTVRGRPSRRVFWRDLHAVTGAFAGLLIAFLAISGLPWATVWGGNLTVIATATGTGYPAELWDDVPTSAQPAAAAVDHIGWTLESSPMPMSTVPTVAGAPAMGDMAMEGMAMPRTHAPSGEISADAGGHDHGGSHHEYESTAPATETSGGAEPIGIDKAISVARSLGISERFDMALPSSPTGVYTASIFPDDVAGQRTIHIDQYSGKPLVDIAFADYGSAAKAIEFGINVHTGQQFGLTNQLLMLATCLAIILSSVAAVVMWLKRRPSGRLGVPPYPATRSVYAALWTMAAVFGLLFPLSGALILAMLAFDVLIVRNVPWLRERMA